jgi:hypothetical protein
LASIARGPRRKREEHHEDAKDSKKHRKQDRRKEAQKSQNRKAKTFATRGTQDTKGEGEITERQSTCLLSSFVLLTFDFFACREDFSSSGLQVTISHPVQSEKDWPQRGAKVARGRQRPFSATKGTIVTEKSRASASQKAPTLLCSLWFCSIFV